MADSPAGHVAATALAIWLRPGNARAGNLPDNPIGNLAGCGQQPYWRPGQQPGKPAGKHRRAALPHTPQRLDAGGSRAQTADLQYFMLSHFDGRNGNRISTAQQEHASSGA
jgi:hypothetical protein